MVDASNTRPSGSTLVERISRIWAAISDSTLLVLPSMSMSIVGRDSGDRQTRSIKAPLSMNLSACADFERRYKNRSMA
jgi:hypothetical protein